jgi:hypothetical protein
MAKDDNDADDSNARPGQSRIVGGDILSAVARNVEGDDVERWITSKSDLSQTRAGNGCLDPGHQKK